MTARRASPLSHYTDKKGYNSIRAVSPWCFKAFEQRNDNPFGAYFTPVEVTDPGFYQKTRLPKKKRAFVFRFIDAGDLTPLRGPRGKYVLYSPRDYLVGERRQLCHGKA